MEAPASLVTTFDHAPGTTEPSENRRTSDVPAPARATPPAFTNMAAAASTTISFFTTITSLVSVVSRSSLLPLDATLRQPCTERVCHRAGPKDQRRVVLDPEDPLARHRHPAPREGPKTKVLPINRS